MNSDYTYPGTNILINLPGIKDQDTLDRFERGRTALRLAELKVKPIKGGFDLEHLKKIHQYIFQDVYPFSGQIRTTNIGKNGFWFADFKSIDWVSGNVFMSLKDDKHFKGLSAEAFSRKAAQYYSDINYIHPFREGNGRAIRELFRQLALESGYDLRWSQVSKEEYMSAVLKTNEPSAIKELSNVLYKCIVGSGGLQDEKWIYPKTETELKDILKKAKGLPDIQDGDIIDSAMLSQRVSRFSLTQDGEKEILQFQLQGETKIRRSILTRVPFLSRETKNKWLDQAAAADTLIEINNDLELGT